MLSDPLVLTVCVAAVILVGLSKGGLGGSMGLVGVPLMELVMSPIQAAAILLPIMILMDVVSLWSWRGFYDRRTLVIMMPGAMAGIGLGWLTASLVTPDIVRLILGAVVLVFVGRWLYQSLFGDATRAAPHNTLAGRFWGMVSGFTSFVAHAGGPPFQIYALGLRLDPKVYTGTSVIYFAVTNAVKLVPYFALGQFGTQNLTTSLALLPLAPLATLAGAWIVKRMRPEVFYPFTYLTVLLVALKLLWDSAAALVG